MTGEELYSCVRFRENELRSLSVVVGGERVMIEVMAESGRRRR